MIDAPTVSNLLDADLPSVVTAAIHTTAIKATSNAYSTNEAARSLAMCARIQVLRNSYDTVTVVPPWLGSFDLLADRQCFDLNAPTTYGPKRPFGTTFEQGGRM